MSITCQSCTITLSCVNTFYCNKIFLSLFIQTNMGYVITIYRNKNGGMLLIFIVIKRGISSLFIVINKGYVIIIYCYKY